MNRAVVRIDPYMHLWVVKSVEKNVKVDDLVLDQLSCLYSLYTCSVLLDFEMSGSA